MIYLTLLVQVILLSLTTASQNAIRIQETFNKMVETMQISVNSKEKMFHTDKIITDFLGNTMKTYNNWLAMDDPLGPDPTEITLSTTALRGKLENKLDAVLKITNQRMVDHSRAGPSLVYTFSEKSQNILAVARAVLDGPDVIFTGDYTATGFFHVSPSLSIPFYGKGWWTFYGNDMAELVTYEGYTVNSNRNINISAALSTTYVCIVRWNDIEFKGLQFDYKNEIDVTWMPMLQRHLAELYAEFLKHPVVFEKFQNHNPPKRLLNKYLEQSLTALKLTDTILTPQPLSELFTTCHANYINKTDIAILVVIAYFTLTFGPLCCLKMCP